MIIHADNPFSVPANYFALGESESGYDLMYSASGLHYTLKDHVPAHEEVTVANCPKGLKIMLSGNTSDVYLQY